MHRDVGPDLIPCDGECQFPKEYVRLNCGGSHEVECNRKSWRLGTPNPTPTFMAMSHASTRLTSGEILPRNFLEKLNYGYVVEMWGL
jgi:hypothetical protein